MDLRIIEDYIKAIEASHFQDFCDRLLSTLYKDFTDVRAGGRNGDMKNDGYCYMSRIFFQAHATRGESANNTKNKIIKDFNGCIEKWSDVKSFIYITNDTLLGEIENFIDTIRKQNPAVIIETWTPKKIINKIKNLQQKDIEYIIERKISQNPDICSYSKKVNEQFEKDCYLAKIYETEIFNFIVDFRFCLGVTLPQGDNIDVNIDEVFRYNNLAGNVNFEKVTKELMVDVFTKYEFRNTIINFDIDSMPLPTSFQNLIGILIYFNGQLEKHLNKYGSTCSTELINKIEYMQRMIQCAISETRFEVRTSQTTTNKYANFIADFFLLLKKDIKEIKQNYTKYVTGGFPIAVGKVTKSDKTNGEIMINLKIGNY